MRNWVEWHEAYERPSSFLSRRLEVVKRDLRAALDRVDQRATIGIRTGGRKSERGS